jgi:hypothetical protein
MRDVGRPQSEISEGRRRRRLKQVYFLSLGRNLANNVWGGGAQPWVLRVKLEGGGRLVSTST